MGNYFYNIPDFIECASVETKIVLPLVQVYQNVKWHSLVSMIPQRIMTVPRWLIDVLVI